MMLKVSDHVKASKQKSRSPLLFLSNLNICRKEVVNTESPSRVSLTEVRNRKGAESGLESPRKSLTLEIFYSSRFKHHLEEDVVFSIHIDFSHIFARCADSRDFIVNQVTFNIWLVLPFHAIMSLSNKFCK